MTSGVEPRSVPVVVIGNGPVGQTTSLLLARHGVASVVLDEHPERDFVGSKAICQQRDVLDIWDECAGAGAQIAAEGLTWEVAKTFYRDRELFSVEFADAGESRFPPFVNISQCRTEAILADRQDREPAIEIVWGATVSDIGQDADGATVEARTADGKTVRYRAQYVVLAAGSHCRSTHELLGVEFAGRTFGDKFLICDTRIDLPGWATERRFYFDPEWNPGRQVLIHPCPDSTFRIDWQVPEDFDLAREEANGGLDRRIRRIVGERDYEVVWRSVYRFRQQVVDRMQVGRVLLAGDCAHVMAPFGARGLNSGVADAENAAWKIAALIRGWGGPQLVDSYQQERRAAAIENLTVTGRTMDFLVPQSESEWAWRRDVLERAVSEPAARAEVDSGRLSEPFWYVDSPLTVADPSRPFGGRPAKGAVPPPGPGILLPDLGVTHPATGAPVPLRTLMRGSVTVLMGRDVDAAIMRAAAARSVSARLGAPVQVVSVDALRPDLATMLGIKPDEIFIARPDAYLAALRTAASLDDVPAAIDSCLGHGSLVAAALNSSDPSDPSDS